MVHMKALVFKFIASFVLLYIVLGVFYNMSFLSVLLITAALGIVTYIVGDLLILSKSNNFVALLADFGLAFLIIYFFAADLVRFTNPLTMSLLAALGITAFEFFFHSYVVASVYQAEKQNLIQTNLRFQTETAEEIEPTQTEDRKK
ncbi:YndM family protein [Radiobacillus sp. PE A8.2]|uniref:YndM family protein n=1 Tax=Radiobacillus sp. PE A8.2 TaxID=3380349 RepID=UPI00388DB27E